jgi:hypothetical protein
VADYESLRKTAAQKEAAIFLPIVSAQDKGRQEEAANIVSVYFPLTQIRLDQSTAR